MELLREQFKAVWIPPAVGAELARLEHAEAKQRLLASQTDGWLQVRSLNHAAIAAILTSYLDQGEAEAITLAVELKADYLLMDERAGRLAARQAGLHVTGVLGVLLKAKLTGRIKSLREEIEALRSQAHFFIKKDLELALLKVADE